ncbi:hypothetical protein GPA19_08110 [Azoarcus indigens]|uniref:Uncharacterized protein n=1 Tax=Azoarcus indigens TaxID=29545 RepID=A0A4R6DYL4_9RHOO|nr:hypothetical protein [Azoarcus indigens]NMG64908.1 hypothetical protein [Azoarcus indigens]TDN50445.1 hypothetical protein C7389_109139 [Azoarcus indigens]
MDYPQDTPISRIPGRPTLVLLGPQGIGKSLFAAALTKRLGCTHCLDGDDVNGAPKEEGAVIPHDGALVINVDGGGGDLTITANTQAGFDALVNALGIPAQHRPPYAKAPQPGPGPEFGWDVLFPPKRFYPPTPSQIACEVVFAGTTNEASQPSSPMAGNL